MIEYRSELTGASAEALEGFGVGWRYPLCGERLLTALQNSDFVEIAWDGGTVVGFVSAISDQVLSAYIPLLEVLPAYQGQGIGSELARRMLDRLSHLYMVDLLCDPDLQPFYGRFGLSCCVGMARRNFEALRLP